MSMILMTVGALIAEVSGVLLICGLFYLYDKKSSCTR